MATLYRADGRIEDYPAPANGTDYQLEELQAAIGGGWIEIAHTKDGRLMVIDEEGKLKRLPVSAAATVLYIYGAQDPICGDALVCEDSQIL